MATGANPLLGGGRTLPPELMQRVMGALSARTQGAAAGPTPGRELGERFSQAQGSDPTMVLRQLEQINQILGVLFVKTFQSLPNVANQISSTMKQLSRAVKEAQQASNVSETIEGPGGSQPSPITFSAAQAGENAGPPSYAGAA